MRQERRKFKGPVAGGRMGCHGIESRPVKLDGGEQRGHRRPQRSCSQTTYARPCWNLGWLFLLKQCEKRNGAKVEAGKPAHRIVSVVPVKVVRAWAKGNYKCLQEMVVSWTKVLAMEMERSE